MKTNKQKTSGVVQGLSVTILVILLGLRRNTVFGRVRFLEPYVVFALAISTLSILKSRKSISIPREGVVGPFFLLLFTLVGVWSSLNRPLVDERVLWAELFRIMFVIILFWLTLHLARDPITYQFILGGAVLVSLYLSISFFRMIIQENMIALLQQTFVDPNYYASFILVLLWVMIPTLVIGSKGLVFRLLIFFLILSLSAQLVVTLSRGAWVAFSVSLLYAMFRLFVLKAWKGTGTLPIYIVGGLGGGMLFLLNLYQYTPNLFQIERWLAWKTDVGQARLPIYSSALRLISEYPLTGVGPGQSPLYIGTVSHNLFLEVALASGSLAVISFAIWLAFICVRLYKANTHFQNQYSVLSVSLGIEIALFALLLHSMTLNAFTLRHLWFLLAVATNIANYSSAKENYLVASDGGLGLKERRYRSIPSPF